MKVNKIKCKTSRLLYYAYPKGNIQHSFFLKNFSSLKVYFSSLENPEVKTVSPKLGYAADLTWHPKETNIKSSIIIKLVY